MSLLAAELGHGVTALDLSPGMLAEARRKADRLGLDIETVVGPAQGTTAGPVRRRAGATSPLNHARSSGSARRIGSPPVLAWLEHVERYAILADA